MISTTEMRALMGCRRKGVSVDGWVAGTWRGRGGAAILTGIEIEKKMNEMRREEEKEENEEERGNSLLGPAPAGVVAPTWRPPHCHSCRLSARLSSHPAPAGGAASLLRCCPLVICIKNIIHCNHKDLRKNACNEPLSLHKMQLPGKRTRRNWNESFLSSAK